ncbi:MAG: addiction module protein [Flavobacteriales bacterium]|nr:addiction module protein [Flavobacteriales bacterium]
MPNSNAMREVILKVPEDKYEFIMELIANLGLEVEAEMEIPEWQKNMVRERVEEYKKNPDIALDWDDVKDDFDLDA